MSVVTRFPPSPTGFMHIGNARTALYNWLFARHHGGKFLVRIEDTDRARHSEEAVDAIFRGLEWLGLDYDGEAVSQFSRRDAHIAIAKELVKQDKAYYCYCSPEELEQMRAEAKQSGRPVAYDNRWRDRDPADAPKDIAPVIRIKSPLEGEITVQDEVQGNVTVKAENLDDFIILRSDKTPTYMLSVVCDDHDMGVTHVMRGDDHLNNTFRQKVIYDAMGWDVPVMAHLPLIHGPDGAKFSKRHGATSVEEYRDMGYLPEAMNNYLLRLGWSHGDDEIISMEQATEWFNVKNIGKAAPSFDFAKLDSLNSHYINTANNERLLNLIIPFLEKEGLTIDDTAKTRLLAGMDELKDRAKTLLQLAEEGAFYAKSAPFDYNEKASDMLNTENAALLTAIKEAFENSPAFDNEAVQEMCKTIANEHCDGKLGKVGMPLRAALTGTTVSPSIFHAAAILGKEECIIRLNHAIETAK